MGKTSKDLSTPDGYGRLASGIETLLKEARKQAARSINAVLTATYWEMGRRIVEFEQGGNGRAGCGEALLERLSKERNRRQARKNASCEVRGRSLTRPSASTSGRGCRS
ncbi:MAG TPA: DUF1016 N-terminal domain-containing protein [Elusimicrobiota bacterium]|nr:DUF1016 N-terminal domain-containing protein [Elusimicrobiota bacterium]